MYLTAKYRSEIYQLSQNNLVLKLFSTLNGDQNGSCKSTNVYAQAQ